MKRLGLLMVLALALGASACAQNVDRSTPGDGLFFDVMPRTIQGYVVVPARPIFKWLGAVRVDYTRDKITAYQKVSDEPSLELWVGSQEARWYGQPYKLDVAPVTRDGQIFVPLRFVGEVFGCRVDVIDRIVRLRLIQYWQKAEMIMPPPWPSPENAVWNTVYSWYGGAERSIGRENEGIRVIGDSMNYGSGAASLVVMAKWRDGGVTKDELTLQLRRSGWQITGRKSTRVDRVEAFPY